MGVFFFGCFGNLLWDLLKKKELLFDIEEKNRAHSILFIERGECTSYGNEGWTLFSVCALIEVSQIKLGADNGGAV